MEYFDRDGKLIFSSFVPASPGDASLSFLGILFDDARIARVRITTGNVPPRPYCRRVNSQTNERNLLLPVVESPMLFASALPERTDERRGLLRGKKRAVKAQVKMFIHSG